ncbi:Uncharacterised protein [Mycobacterium tuberculosis]|nr:Uncharacterised protein [Mycobacterium tuberculosis]
MTRTDFADYALACVDRLFRGIQEHQIAHGAHGDHYSTGVPVASVVDLNSVGARWQKVWHPAPDYPANQPRTLVDGLDLGDGTVGAVIASAPGVLDVVRRNV